MRTYICKEVPQECIDTITCNKCGNKMYNYTDEVEDWQLDTFHEFKIIFGYGDKNDGEIYRFDLCYDCIQKIVKLFKIPVEVKRYL